MYQLRPELSTANMSSCVPRLVRNCISCIERYGCTKCPTVGRLLQFYCTSLYTQLCADMQNCWMISTVCSCPIVLRSHVYTYTKKKSFRGRRRARCVPNIAHFKLLLWSHENTVCQSVCLRKEFYCSKSRSTKHLTPELCPYNSYLFCRIACAILH